MNRRVLLCDDEVHILRAAQFKLSRAGYETRLAGDGEQAWEVLLEWRPDLLITDLQMPRLNGIDLCRRIRANEETRDLPVLMLTAKGYELNASQVRRELGITALLTKPFSPRELAQIVERALADEPQPVPT